MGNSQNHILQLSIYFNQRTNQLRVNCPALAEYIRSDLDYIVVRDTDKSSVFRYLYEDGCYRQYPDDYFKGIIKGYITEYDKDILTMRDVNEVFSLLSTDLEFVSSKMLNTDEGLINFMFISSLYNKINKYTIYMFSYY